MTPEEKQLIDNLGERAANLIVDLEGKLNEAQNQVQITEGQLQATIRQFIQKIDYRDNKIFELQKEIDVLKNDLLDALDLKKGEGPTALSMLRADNDKLREVLKAMCDVISTQSMITWISKEYESARKLLEE